ncbi:MAG: 3-isopropylmalate dehydratase small subunit [Candidatus Altiarchaeales archaeon]|nr:3-isopropylmalate dehydratase small subunit [Candidatus Altiarchaeales archaeon]
MLKGKAHVFRDNVSTDLIVPGRYSHLRSNLAELAKHALEDADPEFSKKACKGDFVVGGLNFGLGSSREHAPIVIKMNGISAVIAKSFARIFYRNCINVGLPAVICDTSKIKNGDVLELDLKAGRLKDLTQNFELNFSPLPKVMRTILEDGGLVEHIKKHKDFKL